MPGSCEALAHWRGSIEELILSGMREFMIAVDIDPTCLATWSGPLSESPCRNTFPKPCRVRHGSINSHLLPSYHQAQSFTSTKALNRVTSSASSRVRSSCTKLVSTALLLQILLLPSAAVLSMTGTWTTGKPLFAAMCGPVASRSWRRRRVLRRYSWS